MSKTKKVKKIKNIFWVVYDNKGKAISMSEDKITACEEALKQSKYRWTYQSFEEDWKYLVKDGYKILKSKVVPCEITIKNYV